MNFEKINISEIEKNKAIDLPGSHMEGVDVSELENLSANEFAEKIGGNVFEETVKRPGLLRAFLEVVPDGSKEDFAKAYSDYVNNPEKLREEKGDVYEFLRDRIFCGREYSVEEREISKQEAIAFGSLADGAFKHDERYKNWEDGVDAGELRKKWILELTNEISDIYGNDKITASAKYGLNNAGMYDTLGKLIYDPQYLRDSGNEYGRDNIIGTLAHEVGHRVIYNIGLEGEIDDYENEACADYIAGLTSRLCKLDREHSLAWYDGESEFTTDDIHPGSSVRVESFMRGWDRIDRGEEAKTLKIFEDFSPYDLEDVYKNSELLKKILYEDVINPLRDGTIKAL